MEQELREIDAKVVDAIKTCYDPEIPVNIYELGLIYKIRVSQDKDVHIDMTLTSPNCPAAQELPLEVKTKVASVEGVNKVDLNIVWDPPWGPHLMSEAAKLELGMF